MLNNPNWNGLVPRVLAGIAMAALALFCILFHPLSFYALIIMVALLMYAEWLELTKDLPLMNKFGGLVYVGLPVWSLIALYMREFTITNPDTLETTQTATVYYVIALVLMVVVTDVAAYFGGKFLGKHKLAPNISPGKTIEGALVALVAVMILAVPLYYTNHDVNAPSVWQMMGFAVLVSIASQIGDLFESWLKRRAGVKDSGHLIPGHGGVLDRMDGLVFAAPVYALLVLL